MTSTAFSPWRITTIPDTDFAGPVQIRHAAPQIRTDRHVADVADPDRRAALAGGHDDALEVGDRLGVAAAAHHVLGAAELDQPTGSLRVTGTHRLDDALDRETVVAQPVRVHVYLVLPAEPAERGDLGHAGHRLQLLRRDQSWYDRRSARLCLPERSISAYWNTQPTPVASGPSSVRESDGRRDSTPERYSSVRVRAQ